MWSKLRLAFVCLAAASAGCASFRACDSPCGPDSDLRAQLDQADQDLSALKTQNADLKATSTDLTSQDTDLEGRNTALLARARERRDQYNLLVRELNQEIGAGQLKVVQYRNMITLEIADSVLFDTAKADLRPVGKALLLKMAHVFVNTDKIVRVVGYTDNVPMAPGAEFDDNWSLSTARAVTVVRFLQTQGGVDPNRLMAAGRSKWLPYAPNNSDVNRQKNRRIEISLVDQDLENGIKFNP